jgi:hypothetical protein
LPRRSAFALALALGLLGPAAATRAQYSEFTIDPALGPYPTFGPGGYISNGFGYRSFGPGGYGPYYPGLYFPPNDMQNGPGPAYSPLYSALIAAPPPDAPSDPASWRLRPSLPGTGRSALREWLQHRRR